MRLLEEHVRRGKPRKASVRSAMIVALSAMTLAIGFTGGGLLAVAETDPLEMSDLSFESVANTALEGAVGLVGGGAFTSTNAGAADEAPPSRTPRPTPAPTPTPVPVDMSTLVGTPYTAGMAVTAWQSAGFAVSQAPLTHAGFTSTITGKSVGLHLSAGGGQLDIALIIYSDAASVGSDWQLASGARPQPKPDRSLPSFETVWWNSNAVVIVLEREGSTAAASGAFFGMR
jgi:hypothetical protein